MRAPMKDAAAPDLAAHTPMMAQGLSWGKWGTAQKTAPKVTPRAS
jgi:hypothetical protein